MSHSYSNNYVHYVHAIYSTKNRENLIPTEFEKRIYSFVASTARERRTTAISSFAACNNIVGIRNHRLQNKLLAVHA